MTGGPWTRSMKVVHGPLVHVLSSPVHACTQLLFLSQLTTTSNCKFLRKVNNVICRRFSGNKLVLS